MEKNKSKPESYLNDDDDSNMKTYSKTEFVIFGYSMSPNELTKIIGINPTSISEKGKLTEKYKQLIKENTWSLESGLDKDTDIQTQTDHLLQVLRPHKSRLMDICKKYPPLLNCTVRIFGGDRPPLDLSKENIKELSEYNAEFGIDIYIFDEE
jgi:hypothetical protein